MKVPEAYMTCSTNSTYDCTLVSSDYLSGSAMEEILTELTGAAEAQGRITHLADALEAEEGTIS